MLTKLTVGNFKRFEEVEIELGKPVVLIGLNRRNVATETDVERGLAAVRHRGGQEESVALNHWARIPEPGNGDPEDGLQGQMFRGGGFGGRFFETGGSKASAAVTSSCAGESHAR